MEQQAPSMVDLGTDAMLELEEMSKEIRNDAPSLKEFFLLLRTPIDSPTFAGNSAVSMLADIRAYPVLREATGIKLTKSSMEYEKIVGKFLQEIERGVEKGDRKSVRKAKDFCSALVSSIISRDMTEIYSKRGDSNNEPRNMNALI